VHELSDDELQELLCEAEACCNLEELLLVRAAVRLRLGVGPGGWPLDPTYVAPHSQSAKEARRAAIVAAQCAQQAAQRGPLAWRPTWDCRVALSEGLKINVVHPRPPALTRFSSSSSSSALPVPSPAVHSGRKSLSPTEQLLSIALVPPTIEIAGGGAVTAEGAHGEGQSGKGASPVPDGGVGRAVELRVTAFLEQPQGRHGCARGSGPGGNLALGYCVRLRCTGLRLAGVHNGHVLTAGQVYHGNLARDTEEEGRGFGGAGAADSKKAPFLDVALRLFLPPPSNTRATDATSATAGAGRRRHSHRRTSGGSDSEHSSSSSSEDDENSLESMHHHPVSRLRHILATRNFKQPKALHVEAVVAPLRFAFHRPTVRALLAVARASTASGHGTSGTKEGLQPLDRSRNLPRFPAPLVPPSPCDTLASQLRARRAASRDCAVHDTLCQNPPVVVALSCHGASLHVPTAPATARTGTAGASEPRAKSPLPEAKRSAVPSSDDLPFPSGHHSRFANKAGPVRESVVLRIGFFGAYSANQLRAVAKLHNLPPTPLSTAGKAPTFTSGGASASASATASSGIGAARAAALEMSPLQATPVPRFQSEWAPQLNHRLRGPHTWAAAFAFARATQAAATSAAAAAAASAEPPPGHRQRADGTPAGHQNVPPPDPSAAASAAATAVAAAAAEASRATLADHSKGGSSAYEASAAAAKGAGAGGATDGPLFLTLSGVALSIEKPSSGTTTTTTTNFPSKSTTSKVNASSSQRTNQVAVIPMLEQPLALDVTIVVSAVPCYPRLPQLEVHAQLAPAHLLVSTARLTALLRASRRVTSAFAPLLPPSDSSPEASAPPQNAPETSSPSGRRGERGGNQGLLQRATGRDVSARRLGELASLVQTKLTLDVASVAVSVLTDPVSALNHGRSRHRLQTNANQHPNDRGKPRGRQAGKNTHSRVPAQRAQSAGPPTAKNEIEVDDDKEEGHSSTNHHGRSLESDFDVSAGGTYDSTCEQHGRGEAKDKDSNEPKIAPPASEEESVGYAAGFIRKRFFSASPRPMLPPPADSAVPADSYIYQESSTKRSRQGADLAETLPSYKARDGSVSAVASAHRSSSSAKTGGRRTHLMSEELGTLPSRTRQRLRELHRTWRQAVRAGRLRPLPMPARSPLSGGSSNTTSSTTSNNTGLGSGDSGSSSPRRGGGGGSGLGNSTQPLPYAESVDGSEGVATLTLRLVRQELLHLGLDPKPTEHVLRTLCAAAAAPPGGEEGIAAGDYGDASQARAEGKGRDGNNTSSSSSSSGGGAVAAAVRALTNLYREAQRGKAALSIWRRRTAQHQSNNNKNTDEGQEDLTATNTGRAAAAGPTLLRFSLTALRIELVAQVYDLRSKIYVGGLALVDKNGHHMLHLAPMPPTQQPRSGNDHRFSASQAGVPTTGSGDSGGGENGAERGPSFEEPAGPLQPGHEPEPGRLSDTSSLSAPSAADHPSPLFPERPPRTGTASTAPPPSRYSSVAMEAAAAAVEAEAELAAYKQHSMDRRKASLLIEVQQQRLQRGHGCGWGLGDDHNDYDQLKNHEKGEEKEGARIPTDAAEGVSPDQSRVLLEDSPARVDRRVRVEVGRVDLIGVPETALATAELLVAGFSDSHHHAAQSLDAQDGNSRNSTDSARIPGDDHDDNDDEWLLAMLHAPPTTLGVAHNHPNKASPFSSFDRGEHHHYRGAASSSSSRAPDDASSLPVPVVVVGGSGSHSRMHSSVGESLQPGNRYACSMLIEPSF